MRRGKMHHIFSSTILESFHLLATMISIKSNWPMFQNRLALLYITSFQLEHYDDITSPSPVRKGDQSLFFKSIKNQDSFSGLLVNIQAPWLVFSIPSCNWLCGLCLLPVIRQLNGVFFWSVIIFLFPGIIHNCTYLCSTSYGIL